MLLSQTEESLFDSSQSWTETLTVNAPAAILLEHSVSEVNFFMCMWIWITPFLCLQRSVSSTDREQSLQHPTVCLWRVTGPKVNLQNSVMKLDPQTQSKTTETEISGSVIMSLLQKREKTINKWRDKWIKDKLIQWFQNKNMNEGLN